MKVETIEDVVDWAQALHSRLAECLADCSAEHEKLQAQWLLTYLADHERTISKVISGMSPDDSVLNTWIYDYIGHAPIDPHRTCDRAFAEMSFEEICTAVFDLHNQAIKLFAHLASRAEIPSTREFINQLLDIEQHETMRLAQQANRIRDL